MRGRLFLGTSGYVYPHWRRRFYPRGLPSGRWLTFYAAHFVTVELNSPFYRLPAKVAFRAWRAAVPDDFVFAVKASRYLTHLKRLREPARPVDRLLRRLRPLGPTLGPVLFQLPAQFHANLPRLRTFLNVLGRQRHVPGLRAVLEVRHASWLEPETLALLRKQGSPCACTTAGSSPSRSSSRRGSCTCDATGPAHATGGLTPRPCCGPMPAESADGWAGAVVSFTTLALGNSLPNPRPT
jgi:uncharacterized protein YecE (DUF72 family)